MSYIKSCCDFSFIVGLVSLKTLLHPLHAVTIRLQGKTVDIIQAYEDVTSVIGDLRHLRENVEVEFAVIFQEAVRMADEVSVGATIHQTASRQIHRNNTPASTP